MGDQRSSKVATYLTKECSGFVSTTTRSFLKRHADPTVLLGQLKSLYKKGEHSTCSDLIQWICEEMHPLSTASELFLLRAQIAWEDETGLNPAKTWLKQALLNNPDCQQSKAFSDLLDIQDDLADGLYQESMERLKTHLENTTTEMFAHFLIGRHLLLKTQNVSTSIFHLESALQLKPAFKKCWEALGFAFNRSGQKVAAQKAFARCIELETNPEKVNFYKQQLAS